MIFDAHFHVIDPRFPLSPTRATCPRRSRSRTTARGPRSCASRAGPWCPVLPGLRPDLPARRAGAARPGVRGRGAGAAVRSPTRRCSRSPPPACARSASTCGAAAASAWTTSSGSASPGRARGLARRGLLRGDLAELAPRLRAPAARDRPPRRLARRAPGAARARRGGASREGERLRSHRPRRAGGAARDRRHQPGRAAVRHRPAVDPGRAAVRGGRHRRSSSMRPARRALRERRAALPRGGQSRTIRAWAGYGSFARVSRISPRRRCWSCGRTSGRRRRWRQRIDAQRAGGYRVAAAFDGRRGRGRRGRLPDRREPRLGALPLRRRPRHPRGAPRPRATPTP